jgi:alpha-beta hydrolase superfamily lysophospholipase
MTIELDEAPLGKRIRGPDLYYASAMPREGLKAVLGIVPGYADHGARFRHVMGAFAEHGIGSVAIDLRGHGRALGRRGYCDHFDEYLDDARELRRLVDDRAKGVPTFLYGQSFGALVATSSVLENAGKLRGLILTAPYFELAVDVPKVKVALGKIASRLLPRFSLPTGIKGSDLTHDAERARAYEQDPLVFPNATARWFTEAAGAQQRVFANAARLSVPLFITHGTNDPIAKISGAKRFFDSAGTSDKTWDPREGLKHEPLNEPSWKEIVEKMARWILERSKSQLQ